MGDRGTTATDVRQAGVPGECNRWEIGGQPQLVRPAHGAIIQCNRWEVGGQPQPQAGWRLRPRQCNRWEIGGQPQPAPSAKRSRSSVTDGRSGDNRNSARIACSDASSVTDGRSGDNRNVVDAGATGEERMQCMSVAPPLARPARVGGNPGTRVGRCRGSNDGGK